MADRVVVIGEVTWTESKPGVWHPVSQKAIPFRDGAFQEWTEGQFDVALSRIAALEAEWAEIRQAACAAVGRLADYSAAWLEEATADTPASSDMGKAMQRLYRAARVSVRRDADGFLEFVDTTTEAT